VKIWQKLEVDITKSNIYSLTQQRHYLMQGREEVNMLFFKKTTKNTKRRDRPYIHSHSTYDTYVEVVAKFGDFLFNEMGIKYEKDFWKLSTDEVYVCVDRYFEKQKANGLAKTTLEKHISALNKILGAINPEIKEYFTPDNRARWRDGVEKQDCDRYNNSDRILENLKQIQ